MKNFMKKYLNKRLITLSAIGAVLIGGASVFAISVNQPSEPVATIQVVEESKPVEKSEPKVEKKTEVIVNEPTQEPVQQAATTETAPTVEEEPTVTVKSYDQLISDYNFTEQKSLMDKIKERYPERFTEDMIEDTFAYIDRVYFDVSAAMVNIERHGWDVLR